MIDVEISLQPKQVEFFRSVEDYRKTFYGGAKGGGKSHGLRGIMLARRFAYPKTNGAIFRKTYPELEGNHIRPILQQYPFLREYYNKKDKILTLPNGSTLEFCYARNEDDLDNYQGREFHDLGIEEAGQWTEAMYTKLLGSNRSSIQGVKPRVLLTGNPGGPGHGWLKRLFIDRQFTKREIPHEHNFIQALVQDNPALIDNDPDYINNLNAEKNEALRRAFLYGDWDIIAGQFFTEIRRDIHLIDPFPIPDHWKRFGAYDHGHNHPAAFGWFANDTDGNVYLYREMVKAKCRSDEIAKYVLEMPDTKKLDYIVAGHDCWHDRGMKKRNNTAPTIAEEFTKYEIYLSKANIGRIQGATQVRNYLAWNNTIDGREKPRFYIFKTCPITFDCLTRMEHDPKRAEDVLKVDATNGDPQTGDDPFDMVRYGLMSRPEISAKLPPKHKPGSKEWAELEEARLEKQIEDQFNMQQDIEKGIRAPIDPWSKNPGVFDSDW